MIASTLESMVYRATSRLYPFLEVPPGRTAARAAHVAQELPSSPRQTGENLILGDQLHRHWVGLPDFRAVLTNRTVGGEFARTGRVQDRHACPALAVAKGGIHLLPTQHRP